MPDFDEPETTNCKNGFGNFTPADEHEFGNVCNGGEYDGRTYDTCPSLERCEAATNNKRDPRAVVPDAVLIRRTPRIERMSGVDRPLRRVHAPGKVLAKRMGQALVRTAAQEVVDFTDEFDLFPDIDE